jgi:crotonyl-CoA carboxylase/reductase
LPFYPRETEERKNLRLQDTKKFGKKLFDIIGEKRGPDIVIEHPGQETFPASVFLANKFGKIVICGATTGFDLSFDVRHLWMKQKQIIGSHFANAEECQKANQLVIDGKIKPIVSKVIDFNEIPEAHELLYQNKHLGNLVAKL